MSGSQQRLPIRLRIHGDNILECERALFLIADSLAADVQPLASPPYLPRYEVRRKGGLQFVVELFPGHGRWNVDLQETLRQHGAPLREATDAVITRISQDGQHEEIILALEFCNALPAGNNAWQRNGRALACATAGVPYLYFAEIGGVELGKDRRTKAPRFPNPLVPFSYLTTSQSFDVVCLPVYSPSPSSSEAIRTRFEMAFGLEDGQRLVKCLLEGSPPDEAYERLTQKALATVETLAAQRRHRDTLRGKQWAELLSLERMEQKAAWLEQNVTTWTKKRARKVVITEIFPRLLRLFQECGCLSIGAKTIPICMIPHHKRKALADSISALYGSSATSNFIDWMASSELPLIVIWITGFKPRGDDSRPDRGLVPLARMLWGNEVDVLSIVYGPAKPAMWDALRDSPQQLALQNGLWEVIVHLSDAVLADSATLADGSVFLLLHRSRRYSQDEVRFAAASPTNEFSEQDVDSVLHQLFTQPGIEGIFEGMCNPPGGDWSGLSLLNWRREEEFRWTSLPRVSAAGGKRPDHVVQFRVEGERSLLLAIESKDKASNLKPNVGTRLKTYLRQLVETPPTIKRATNADWKLWQRDNVSLPDLTVASGGAFRWAGEDLTKSIARGQLDMAFAFEFKSVEQPTLLHVKAGAGMALLLPKIRDLVQRFSGGLEIQVH